jgi:hypothetical protein
MNHQTGANARGTMRPPLKKNHQKVIGSDNESESEDADEESIADYHRDFLNQYKRYITAQDGIDVFNTETDVDKFVRGRTKAIQDSLGKSDRHKRTLLHQMFDKPKKLRRPVEKLWVLLEWVMAKYPDLYLSEQDDDRNRTILHMTAQPSVASSGLATAFITAFPHQAATLLQNTDLDNNLLHDTMPYIRKCEVGLFPTLFGALGDKTTATDATSNTVTAKWMAAVDKHGNTALHLAAVYDPPSAQDPKEALDSQLQLVKQVFQSYPQALSKANHNGSSPYQHRVYTFDQWYRKQSSAPGVDMREDEIAYFLKDKIMHLSDREKTIRLLHGEFQGRRKDAVVQQPLRQVY